MLRNSAQQSKPSGRLFPNMRHGRRIAVDSGTARIGVAASTVDGILSSPLATVTVSDQATSELVKLITDCEAIEVYVGLPLNLAGNFTKSTDQAIELARKLDELLDVEVRLVDERLSTRAAQSQLHFSGKNSRQSRSLIDAAAASLILEDAIAFEKATGQKPGKAVLEFDE